jgi:ribulose-phosphate 3-epimerase
LNSLFPRLNETGGVAVAPSVLSADFARLAEEIKAVESAGADCLHLDVMDGHFVDNITFGPMIVEALSRLTSLPLISHLMIEAPGSFAEAFVRAGSSVVSFHWEALESGHEAVIDELHGLGCSAGVAVNPDTPLSAVEHLLGRIELLLVMTVFPGFGGQSFIPGVLDKIASAARLKVERGYRYFIEVDGGVKPENAPAVREAGGEILVAGTAVFKSGSYSEAIAALRGDP